MAQLELKGLAAECSDHACSECLCNGWLNRIITCCGGHINRNCAIGMGEVIGFIIFATYLLV